eukprot:g8206.t1
MSTSPAIVEAFGRVEVSVLRSQDRVSKSGKPATVAGYRECRQSSIRRLRKERRIPRYCIESTAIPNTVVRETTRSAPPPPPSTAIPRTEFQPNVLTTDSSCFRKTPVTKSCKFRTQWQRLKLRTIMNCMTVESGHPQKSDCSENLESTVEQTELANSDCSSRGNRRTRSSKFSSSSCDRTDSTITSRLRTLLTEAPHESRKTVRRLSTALTKMFRTHLHKLRCAGPAVILDTNRTVVSTESIVSTVSPSPSPVRRNRRQETLIKMMERELAEHCDDRRGIRVENNARRTVTELVKHNTAPPRSTKGSANRKPQKIRSRDSSKKGVHKRCATY